jgi:hypothetical protein
MKKSDADALLALMREFLDEAAAVPDNLGNHPGRLLELHKQLGLRIKNLFEKMGKIVEPKSGQRLTKEKVIKECTALGYEVITALQFAGSVMFDQAYRLRLSKEEIDRLQKQLDQALIPAKPPASVKKTRTSKTRAS